MRAIELRVALNGEGTLDERTVRADHRDIRAWLAHTRPGQPLAWARDEPPVQASWLAWHASRRDGWGPATYEAWDRSCAWVEDVEAEAAGGDGVEVDPTNLARTGA